MKRIVVGMSGGVDSSVSAYLLDRNPDYEVIGAFMVNWDTVINNDFLGHERGNFMCTNKTDWKDVQDVAHLLTIPIYSVNFVEEYWDHVFKYFLKQYNLGRTPNPDVLCNKFIKFDYFFKYAFKTFDADYVAMGHYAQIRFNSEIKEYQLLRGKDTSKDQTYFLSRLTQEQLSRTIFPIGHLPKVEVRKIAHQADLPVANKKDSTGICFIGERNFTQFLQNYIPNQPGKIIDIVTMKIEGDHIGTMYYTIGQRKKLDLGGKSEPYYVVGKNVKQNIIYVAKQSQKDEYLRSNSVIVKDVNFINTSTTTTFAATARFRYRQPDVKVHVKIIDDHTVELTYDIALGVTPGQEAVLYQGVLCLGGGEIDQVFWNKKLLKHV